MQTDTTSLRIWATAYEAPSEISPACRMFLWKAWHWENRSKGSSRQQGSQSTPTTAPLMQGLASESPSFPPRGLQLLLQYMQLAETKLFPEQTRTRTEVAFSASRASRKQRANRREVPSYDTYWTGLSAHFKRKGTKAASYISVHQLKVWPLIIFIGNSPKTLSKKPPELPDCPEQCPCTN